MFPIPMRGSELACNFIGALNFVFPIPMRGSEAPVMKGTLPGPPRSRSP